MVAKACFAEAGRPVTDTIPVVERAFKNPESNDWCIVSSSYDKRYGVNAAVDVELSTIEIKIDKVTVSFIMVYESDKGKCRTVATIQAKCELLQDPVCRFCFAVQERLVVLCGGPLPCKLLVEL
jgi:hypothetical protein